MDCIKGETGRTAFARIAKAHDVLVFNSGIQISSKELLYPSRIRVLCLLLANVIRSALVQLAVL